MARQLLHVAKQLKIGDQIHGYKLLQADYIKELNIRPYLLRHEATGAQHLHVEKDGDSNNVFAVGLRTTPKNSTGVAHILEHLALCGSKKYAVRDPFFKMLNRSLATFMNAMTGPDYTVYPFSTQNKQDFENLLSVYTDAVFFPRLRHVDFRQEGWRLEHEKPDKRDTPIVIRGVVYNEMKGVFSSSSAIYCQQVLNNLFPDTTYRYESGGDPLCIPDLTHDELKKFYQTHYHPTNARFFTYGDLPLEGHLKLIDEMVLSKFSENSEACAQSAVQEQAVWAKPKTLNITCPSDPMCPTPDKQSITSVSYMLPTTNINHEEMFALRILTSLLTDGPNAPFHKSLIESGIGSDYSPSTGLANFTKQPYFSIGLQNIKEADIDRVHEIIENTFAEVVKNGFKQERIDAILHNIELGLKHVSGNFGLRLAMSLTSVWNHNGDVIDYLRVNKYVDRIRSTLENDKNFWANLIEKNFLKNSHKLILNMSPDPAFKEKREEREKLLLQSKLAKLKDVDKKTVLYEGMELMKIHGAKEDASILPTLDPSKDISKELLYPNDLKFDSYNGVGYQLSEQPTNEVVHFRAIADVSNKLIENNLIDYLPLFCDVATSLGAGVYNRHAFAQKIELTTGGLSASVMLNPSLSDLNSFKTEVMIGSHCLRRNVPNMFELWSNVFNQIHFKDNLEYLAQLIKASSADLADGIAQSGQTYATKRSSSSLSELALLYERLSGLDYIARVKDMASKESVESIAAKLQAISQIVFDPSNLKCSINAEPDAMPSVIDELKRFVDQVHNLSQKEQIFDIKGDAYEKTKVEDMKFPFATNYVAKSLMTVPRRDDDFPRLVILCKLISHKYLLPNVREKGGAYGAGARLSNTGIMSFYSYRDPNTSKTMQIFDDTAKWLTEGEEYTDGDIQESKLGIFQDIDKPVEPGKRGLSFFTCGETDEITQEYRRKLLQVSKRDVMEVAEKYLNQEKVGRYIL